MTLIAWIVAWAVVTTAVVLLPLALAPGAAGRIAVEMPPLTQGSYELELSHVETPEQVLATASLVVEASAEPPLP